MFEDYLIVHKCILPEYYQKVLEARRLMESGKVKEVSQAVKLVGISRSTFYKYKDYIMEASDISGTRKAVISMMLAHEPGVLSAVLRIISEAGASVLTITQSLPVHGVANVTLSLDVSVLNEDIHALAERLGAVQGAESIKLLAIE